jgi:hypothetical protein
MGLGWRKLTRQAFDLELEDALRPVDVLEPLLARIAEADIRREVVLDKLRVAFESNTCAPCPAALM